MAKFSYCCFIVMLHFVFTGACEDEQDWCSHFSAKCDVWPMLKKICPHTCNSCIPPECLKCEQTCAAKDDGTYECACFDGYTLANNSRNCTDIDECAKKPCAADLDCYNFPGSYECRDKCIRFWDKDYIKSHSYPATCCKLTRGQCGQLRQHTYGAKILYESSVLPWQALIKTPWSWCSGSLINKLWVVSAAHCFERVRNVTIANISVFFGVYDLTQLHSSYHQKRNVVQIIRHNKYDFPRHDIALVKIHQPIVLRGFVQPVCLPNGELLTNGTICYGVRESGDRLRQFDVPLVNGESCRKSYQGIKEVNPATMICAGYEESSEDFCQGMSGGPLACQRCDSCDWFLAGVASFGQGCATPNLYGVYTNVEYYEKWIESNIKEVKIEKKKCHPIEWMNWGDWTECSEKCEQSRIRVCRNGVPGLPGCFGDDFESRVCNTQLCAEDF